MSPPPEVTNPEKPEDPDGPAWHELVIPPEAMAARLERNGAAGVTMVIDSGMGTGEVRDVLSVAGRWIDHWKLGFGTSALTPEWVLREKLEMLRGDGRLVFPGGTLFEAAAMRERETEFFRRAAQLGFSAVEISEGTIALPPDRRRRAIETALGRGLAVISEVGRKDPRAQLTARQMAEQALLDMQWGAGWVVVEGRESGTGVGVFNDAGAVDQKAVETIADGVGEAAGRLVWEAPLKNQQAAFIQRFGGNVNLGNINPARVLAVEALRAGLRFETLQERMRSPR